jgi:hypothetical protein
MTEQVGIAGGFASAGLAELAGTAVVAVQRRAPERLKQPLV